MSVRFIKWAALVQVKDAYEKAVLMVLAEAANSDTGESFLSHKTISTRCSMSLRQVVKVMASLEAAGHLSRQRRNRKGGRRSSDIITLSQSARCAPWGVGQSAQRAPSSGAQGAPEAQPNMHTVHSITLTNNPEEYIGGESFDIAWNSYPHHRGRSSRDQARQIFVAMSADDRALLSEAVVRFRDDYLSTNSTTAFAPAFEKWLGSGQWREYAGGGLRPTMTTISGSAWRGPRNIRAAVVSEAGEGAARSYIDTAEWEEPGTIIARTGTGADRLDRLKCIADMGLLVRSPGKVAA